MKTYSKGSFIAAVALCVMILSSSMPASAAGKIGFVDIDRITEETAFISNLLKGLEEEILERQSALEAKQAEYSRLRQELRLKESVLNDAALEEMRRQARDLFNQMDEENYQLNRMLDDARRERMEPALDRILETVQAVGREQGFDIILRGDTILYGSPSVDITDAVIRRIDGGEPVNTDSAPNNPAPTPTPAAERAPVPEPANSGADSLDIGGDGDGIPAKQASPVKSKPDEE